ncbi:MAG: hypothetical protein IJC02_14285 [Lachnospiraceae bacterium]|nr:hypothetical protein [Lachnospiraceae bacterium]
MLEWNLDIDLLSDMQIMSYERMVKAVYKNINLDKALYQYFNVQKRIIECSPRKVHKSNEFTCLELYEVAINNFEKKVKSGEALLPLLGNKLLDASYSDGMLNDWNISFSFDKQI